MKKLNDIQKYRSFVNERDDALERILNNHRLRVSEAMDSTFIKILETVKLKYDLLKNNLSHFQKHHINSIELEINHILENLGVEIFGLLVDLRKKTYLLSYLGEFKAIDNVVVNGNRPHLTKDQLDNLALGEKFNGNVDPIKSISFALSKIRQEIINAIQYSLIHDEDVNKVMGRVYLALPRPKTIPKKQSLKRVKATEADKDFSFGINIDLDKKSASRWGFEIDPDTWQSLIDDVKSEYIPVDRSPDEFFDIKNPWNDNPIREEIPSDEKFYAWEVERDMTHDFVQQVRSGQIEAANQNGIDEFVWIAIVDDHTCDKCCGEYGCIDFHGKLTSEVEKMTNGMVSTPSAHFNCRCTLAPASKDLEYKPEFTEEDFNQWLNS